VCGVAGKIKYEKSTTLFQKLDPTYDSCPLGDVMTVFGGAYPEVAGAYKKTTDTVDSFAKVGGLAKITWHISGCGWVVSRKVSPATSRIRRLEECEDKPAALATILGSDSSENLCETLVEGWGRAAYCSDPIVGKLCANTCDRCDLEKADPAVCENAVCGNEVYQALCPTTCASAVVLPVPAVVVSARLTDLRIRVKNVLPAWKAKQLIHEEEQELARRLGTEERTSGAAGSAAAYQNMYEEVYRTFGTAGADITPCQTGSLTPSYTLAPYMSLFDMVAYHTPVSVGMTHSCPTTADVYVTSNFTYCPRTNIFVQHHAIAKISDNACWTKCGTYGNTTDTFFADGTTDWCSGFSSTFTKETTALCIPRETCEEICTMLGAECHSIDMHRSRPLCYLNDATPGTGNSCSDPSYLVNDPDRTGEFDLLTKVTTPSAAEKDMERVYWTTYTGKALKTPTDGFPTVQNFTYYQMNEQGSLADRVKCEHTCLHDDDCYGFYLDMGASPPQCTIVLYDCKAEYFSGRACNPMPIFEPGYLIPGGRRPMAGGGAVGQLPGLVGEGTFVLKNVPAPCAAGISTAGGVVTMEKKLGFSPDGAEYVSAGCDGWRYETHLSPLAETLTLSNCTDYPPGANVYLKMYLSVMPPAGQTDFKFPCQYAYDEGYCTDLVIQGLCAHSCSPLKVAVLQGKITKYQDITLPIDYTAAGLTEPAQNPNMHENNTECTGNNDVAAFYFIKTYVGFHWEDISWRGPSASGDYLFSYCDDLAGWSRFYNTTDASCVLRPWSPIIMGLCKTSCATYVNPVDDPTTPPPIDETSPTGALFTVNRRLLRINEAKVAEERAKLVQLGELAEDGAEPLGQEPIDEEHRRLRKLFFVPGEYTTSNMGAGPGFYEDSIITSVTVTYTAGDAPDSSWMPVYQTWANGTDNANSIYAPGFMLAADFTPTLGTTCAGGTALGSAAMYTLLEPTAGAKEMYPSSPPVEDDVSLDYSCRTTIPCPMYFTCIVD
jgi:hypothetical protein